VRRAGYRVPRKARLQASVRPKSDRARRALAGERDTILRLAQLSELAFDGARADVGAHAVLADGSDLFVALEGEIDVQQECRRLSGELTRLDQQLSALGTKLTNQNFVARAPAEVVARERENERASREERPPSPAWRTRSCCRRWRAACACRGTAARSTSSPPRGGNRIGSITSSCFRASSTCGATS